MAHNKWGIYAPNVDNYALDRMIGMGVDNFTFLHIWSKDAAAVRAARPNANILFRAYHPDVMSHTPKQWAEECSLWFSQVKHISKRITPANELNLAHEGGGWEKEDYERQAIFCSEWADWFRKMHPDAILHAPALASGHGEDIYEGWNNFFGYGILKPAYDKYDVVNVHTYWRYWGHGLTIDDGGYWYALRFARPPGYKDNDDPGGLHYWFPDKLLFIAECGNFGSQHPDFASQLIKFFSLLYDYPYVIGATPFIWDSDQAHGGNVWRGNWNLIDTIDKQSKPEVEVYPVPDYNPDPNIPPPIDPWPDDPPTEEEEGEAMPDDARIQMLLDQNALIVEGFKQILQGKFTGADGLAGTVVALQGGQPLGFEPSWPPKN